MTKQIYSLRTSKTTFLQTSLDCNFGSFVFYVLSTLRRLFKPVLDCRTNYYIALKHPLRTKITFENRSPTI